MKKVAEPQVTRFCMEAQECMINDDEVELCVVKAITAKLVECKLDRMNQVVVVSCCTESLFGQQQWHSLLSKLATWRVKNFT
ncbi:hypothetical protein V6N13_051850 [Hibiscus sabdariffa]